VLPGLWRGVREVVDSSRRRGRSLREIAHGFTGWEPSLRCDRGASLGIYSISGSVMINRPPFLRTLLVSDGDAGPFFGRPFAWIVLPATPAAFIEHGERGGVRWIRGLGGED
jgi:hypothetical protein